MIARGIQISLFCPLPSFYTQCIAQSLDCSLGTTACNPALTLLLLQEKANVDHDGERWVAVGASGTIIYSTDGMIGDSWTTASSVPTGSPFIGVKHDGLRWVAVGNAGAVIIISEYPHTGDAWKLASSIESTSGLSTVEFSFDL